MLPAPHRLRRSTDFVSAVRSGARARGRTLVVHQLISPAGGPAEAPMDGPVDAAAPARVGLVVSKAVGVSVVRHRVSRRIRAQMAERVGLLPAGSATVVRALPSAAAATSAGIGADLDRALAKLAAGTAVPVP